MLWLLILVLWFLAGGIGYGVARANKKGKEKFYLYVHDMQPLIQYQLVPDLELTKRLMRHTFTSLLREGCEAGSAAHS